MNQIGKSQLENTNIFVQESIKKHLEGESPYLTIRDFAMKYSAWTESSIRWLIYNNTSNFNEIVVRRIGKSKILLSVSSFWNWIEMQNQKSDLSA